MTAAPADQPTLDQIALGEGVNLEELVDRDALTELAASFYELFRVPLRIFSQVGILLADASEEPAVYEYLRRFRGARAALQEVVGAVKRIDTGPKGEASYVCFTGAVYQVVAVQYDQRVLGRMVLGPFLPPTVKEIPQSLIAVDAGVDRDKIRELLPKMARAREETVRQIARHLRATLDLILFSGHKALLTSSMHLASVKESFRDLQEKNEKLQETYNRLKELDRLKSNFLATVSHELRTPLTSIIGYSEMLTEGIAGEMVPEQREFVATIHEKGEQLLELITGLLDMSKLESGTLQMRRKEVEVDDIVRDVLETLSPAAAKHNVELTSNVESHLPAVWGDPTRLRQILLNLTENALKFTPEEGRVSVEARLTSMQAPRPEEDDVGVVLLSSKRPAVQFRVVDTGIGVPDAEKQNVFQAFYQVDSSSTRQAGGTGLGLSIVKRLVEAHDGTIEVQDNASQGTVFAVTIPCRRTTLS